MNAALRGGVGHKQGGVGAKGLAGVRQARSTHSLLWHGDSTRLDSTRHTVYIHRTYNYCSFFWSAAAAGRRARDACFRLSLLASAGHIAPHDSTSHHIKSHHITPGTLQGMLAARRAGRRPRSATMNTTNISPCLPPHGIISCTLPVYVTSEQNTQAHRKT